jgi:hypothetical protein
MKSDQKKYLDKVLYLEPFSMEGTLNYMVKTLVFI